MHLPQREQCASEQPAATSRQQREGNFRRHQRVIARAVPRGDPATARPSRAAAISAPSFIWTRDQRRGKT
jgi:hypothetical protein